MGSGERMKDEKYILVVDDSIIITNFIKKIFNNSLGVLTAANGYEAIEIVKANEDNISGMLLDLNMPHCDGFQVLEYFKQNGLFSKIPVSLLTGEESKDSIAKAFEYPIVDMLYKPFNAANAIHIVEKTISVREMKQK